MYYVLSITIPFFAIIFLGTFFRSLKIFDNSASEILTKFALFVTLPPFMFINILKSSKDLVFNWYFIICFEFITIIILITSFFISFYFFKNNKKNSSLFALNSAYPNYGYMGIPLCILAFGEAAVIPISLILLIDTIILLSFSNLIIGIEKKEFSFKKFIFLIINLFKNPILLATILGFLFVLFKIDLNIIIFDFLTIISYAATPTALFAIGINIYNRINKDSFSQVSIISLFKLIIHPLLIYLIFFFNPYSVPLLWIKVAILSSSLPVAGNVFAMSFFYNSYLKNTSNSILITTILSTITVPIILFLLLDLKNI